MTTISPVILRGEHVVLEPLAVDHVDALVEAANVDRSAFTHSPVPNGWEAMATYVDGLLADQAAGLVVPFVQRKRLSNGTSRVVGATRYLDIKWWPNGGNPAELEIGGTWLGAEARRTGVNTEAKLLLLAHAFDVLDVWRVAIMTDERNTASKAAIERIGASFEGVLRNFRLGGGSEIPADPPYRNTAAFSVIREEWPRVRLHIETLLAEHSTA